MGNVVISQRYLHRLPIRPAGPVLRAGSGPAPRLRLGVVVAALALFGISSLGAVAIQRMGASLHREVPTGWPANGCLRAVVLPLGAYAVTGEARLCFTDSGLHGTVDVEHMEPAGRYAEWIVYFESPNLCSAGALVYQISNFTQTCSLADLDGEHPHGFAREITESEADAAGELHVDAAIREIYLRPHDQAWLLVSQPAWSPLPHSTGQPAQDAPSKPIAHAVFNLP